MRKSLNLFIIFLLCTMVQLFAQDVTRLSNLYYAKKVIVDATQPWTASGINVSSGDKITIVVDGVANTNFNNEPLWVGPEGWAIHLDPNTPIPDKAAYSVIGKIGSSGSPFYVARFTSYEVNVDGELYLGYNDSNFGDNYGYYLAFVFHSSLGTTTLQQVENTPNEFDLKQNYPNPFNPSTTIEFSVPSSDNVELTIFNELGVAIKTVINKNMQSGTYNVIWDGTNSRGIKVSSGRYYYQISIGQDVQTKKMILLK